VTRAAAAAARLSPLTSPGVPGCSTLLTSGVLGLLAAYWLLAGWPWLARWPPPPPHGRWRDLPAAWTSTGRHFSLKYTGPPKIDLVDCVGIHTLPTIPAHANA
jgi:hypothetical protein